MEFLWCELVACTRTDPDDGEKKKLLKTSVSSVPVMASIATQEVIDIAKGHIKWTYNVYYDILMRQAIDNDRSKNCVTKGSKTTTSINKAKREANQAERDVAVAVAEAVVVAEMAMAEAKVAVVVAERPLLEFHTKFGKISRKKPKPLF